jgi:hypothetical protein
MNVSKIQSHKDKVGLDDPFVVLVEAAMRRAACKVAAENKRLGLPLIVAPALRPSTFNPESKRRKRD